MSLTTILNEEISLELGIFFETILDNIRTYDSTKETALKQRMIIIGKVTEYMRQFPQRSTDARLLAEGMRAEKWTDDIISTNYIAYKEYRRLLSGAPEYCQVAEAASVSHLQELSKNEDKTIVYDALQFLKRNGKMPSVKKLQAHKQKWCNNKFEHKGGGARSSSSSHSLPSSSSAKPNPPAPSYPAPQTGQETGMKNITKDAEFDVINASDTTIDTTAETIDTDVPLSADEITRKNVDALVELIEVLNTDFVSFDPKCISKLKPYRYQLEALVSAAERQIKPPTHYA
tara:strand:- start:757 stop:1620 length:864 start_codon:yes stop_codon:yes gene_type:complete